MVRNVLAGKATWLCLVAVVSLVFGAAFAFPDTHPAQKRGGRAAEMGSRRRARPPAPKKELFPRCKTEVKSDEILVKFNRPASREAFQELIYQVAKGRAFRFEEVGSSRALLLINIEGLRVADLLSEFTTLNARKQALKAMVDHDLEVVYVEPNFILYNDLVPNDERFLSGEQWGLRDSGVGRGGISAVSAWDTETGSADIVVGVVDTGIHFEHPDLAENIWEAPRAFTVPVAGGVTCEEKTHGFNAPAKTCVPSEPEESGETHGTRVAGIIGARGNNKIGIAGVNWTARLMGLRTHDASGQIKDCRDVVNAIAFAVEVKKLPSLANVRVLNNSYGYSTTQDTICPSNSLADAISEANAADILFVASAGDGVMGVGQNNDVRPHYPSNYNIPNVIAVAATKENDRLASFSNYGLKTVHLGAPGANITSTNRPNLYRRGSGTSFAAPFVSGAAALILSHCPTLTTAALKACILDNADEVPSLATRLPNGRRLNVKRAMDACGRCAP
jgi:subtilisin family serine protease